MKQQVFHGNNLELLKQYPDNYFDAIVTDPPYGLGKEPNAEEMLQAWITDGYLEVKGSGFMGKEWDAFVPQPIFWKEVFRTLKHGGHVLSFFGTRTYDWGVMAMRLAGFEIRDCIQWIYGCLSEDTEVLTKSGYIQYHKIKNLPNFEQQEILIYDVENDIYKWEKPQRWSEYNIDQDTCYRIKSNSTDQIVSRNHRCLVEREGKLIFIQAEQLSQMEYMPTLSNDFFVLQESQILQSSMQWGLSGSRMETTRSQRKESMVGRNEREISKVANGREQSCLEGRNYISEKERVLFGSQIEVCEMPERVYVNGEKRWLCGGVPINNGKAVRKSIVKKRVCASHRPQSNEQRYNEFDVVFNEQGTQAIRMGRSYSTTLATITPFEYKGVIFCPTVSTGCFVARRNGQVFITGNSGFPKSHNISKAIDKSFGAEREIVGEIKRGDIEKAKQNGSGYLSDPANRNNEKQFGYGIEEITIPSTDQAKQWEGWGSSLKPSNEPIVLARKPLEKGLSIAENVMKWGTGGINIDGCRIGYKSDDHVLKYEGYSNGEYKSEYEEGTSYKHGNQVQINTKGRFPANLILSHHAECECKGVKKIGSGKEGGYNYKGNVYDVDGFVPNNSSEANSNYGQETIEDWTCNEDCPIRIMDEQSGISKSQKSERGNIVGNQVFGKYNSMEDTTRGHIDKGGASRFFYCAKASKSERNKGLTHFEEKIIKGRDEGQDKLSVAYKPRPTPMANVHPTVKPVALMQYLVRMITPPNGIVLDPFNGSGTTGIACKLEGFEYVGMELDAEYCKIAQARIDNFVPSDLDYSNETQEEEDNQDKSKGIDNQMSLF